MTTKTTTKKKKPKCTKGTACGYSCIASGKVCNQPVPKEAAEENLAAVPAKGKKKAEPKAAKQDANAIWEAAMKDKSKVAMSIIKEVDPKNLKLTKADLDMSSDRYKSEYRDDDDMVAAITNLAKKQGIDPDTALAMGHGLRAWVGPQFGDCSQLTYKATDEIEENYELNDKGKPAFIRKRNVSILAAATAALKVLPPVKDNGVNLKKDPGYKDWDKKTLNRWINIPIEGVDSFAEKYKKGETVTEDGMFGTSIHTADKMAGSFATGNITYKVKPKLDGTGRGRYIEHLKPGGLEGEVLYVPGTKFKVSNVTKEENEIIEDPGIKYSRPSIGVDEDGMPLPLTKENYKEQLKNLKDYREKYKDSIEELNSKSNNRKLAQAYDDDFNIISLDTEKDVAAAIEKGFMVEMAGYGKVDSKPAKIRKERKLIIELEEV